MRIWRCSRGFIVAAMGSLASLAGAQTLPAVEVRAPHWGEVLFQHHQERTLDTLMAIGVSQNFARLAPHAAEAELLRGGVLLAWGQHDDAAAVFERVLADPALQAVHDRAWYHLARVRHERGETAAAEAALARIGSRELAKPLQIERVLLGAQLRLLQGDATGSAAILNTLPPGAPTEATLTARFNLGVALLRQGDREGAIRWLQLVGLHGPARNDEEKALRDRANLALGLVALRAGEGTAAELALNRIRLQGPEAGRALLALGWAQTVAGRPRQALVAWRTLLSPAGSPAVGDGAVLEAHIALPHALADLGAPTQALSAYEQAIAHYDREQGALASAAKAVADGSFIQALLAANAAPALHAWASASALPASPPPYAAQLAPLIAEHAFQAGWRHLRDLRHFDGRLVDAKAQLQIYVTMLDERRGAFERKLSPTREAAAARSPAPLRERLAALKVELDRAQAEGDWAMLADAPLRAYGERIERSRRTLAAAELPLDAAARDELTERLRRAEGAWTFALAQGHADRAWQATKALRDGERQLVEAERRDASLAAAQVDEPRRLAALAARIAALQTRIDGLQPRLVALASEQQAVLQTALGAEIAQLQDKLGGWALQARFASAQLLDQAQQAQAAGSPAGSLR
ncbi:MAG: hypothetical protein LW768_01345 [Rubrivivax sp.]|jgi:hypothetical protein|nr:hypothetical protein [Rubrivivax sp.]